MGEPHADLSAGCRNSGSLRTTQVREHQCWMNASKFPEVKGLKVTGLTQWHGFSRTSDAESSHEGLKGCPCLGAEDASEILQRLVLTHATVFYQQGARPREKILNC